MCRMVKRTNQQMIERTYERLTERTTEQMNENERTHARTNERTNELTNVWTTPELGYINIFLYICIYIYFVDDVVGGCVAMVL